MIKTTSSKLLKLKKWLTLPNVAKHLSIAYGEEVTEADILRWGLDGHLKLSVYFKDTVYGTKGYLKENTELCEVLLARGPIQEPVLRAIALINESFSKYVFVESEEERVEPISEGVFDLPMIGGERKYIEREWQELIDGPKENSKCLEEVIIEDDKGNVYALKEVFDDNEHFIKSPVEDEQERLKEFEKEWFEKKIPQRNYSNYYPAYGLPLDSVLVVRIEALKAFELFINDESESNATIQVDTKSPVVNAKPNGHEERHAKKREQILGAAFAVLAKWPEECRDKKGEPVASKIAAMIDAKADLFWPSAQPPLVTDSIEDHLRVWIKKVYSRK